jgi:hypothetical protein
MLLELLLYSDCYILVINITMKMLNDTWETYKLLHNFYKQGLRFMKLYLNIFATFLQFDNHLDLIVQVTN